MNDYPLIITERKSLLVFLVTFFSLIITSPDAYAIAPVWLGGPFGLNDGSAGGGAFSVPVIVQVTDPAADTAPAADTVTVKITSDSDPIGFDLTLVETGGSTGIFENTNLALMDGNDVFSLSDTATITIFDDTGVGPSIVDGSILIVSDSDVGGIAPVFTETSPGSNLYTATINFAAVSNPPTNTLGVSAGDIISIVDMTGGNIANGIISPNPSGSKGAISAAVGESVYAEYDNPADIADFTVSNYPVGGRGSGGLLAPGLVVDTKAPSVVNQVSSSNYDCIGDCYPPHFGMDKFGRNVYDNGLTINGVIYDINNDFHTAPNKILNLTVGKIATFVIKTEDTEPDQVIHGELSIGIPKGDFNKQDGTFLINIDRKYPDDFTTRIEGDKTAFRQLSTELKIEGKNTYFVYSFIPTRHLQHDMFAIYVRDVYGFDKLTFVNHGVFFRGISETGTPVYDVFDDKGRMSTITIVDRTLEDLTVAVDQDGKIWRLDKDKFWKKDYEKPENFCTVTTRGFDRNCPEFKHMVLGQHLIAKQYFDSLQIQKEIKPYGASAEYSDTSRLHDSIPNMMKAQAELFKYVN
jgi:hypothetical protein